MIMAAKALLDGNKRPTDQQIKRGPERPSVPLRRAQSYRARRAAPRQRRWHEHESLSRRAFLKTSGALVIAFSLAPAMAVGQDKPPRCRAASTPTACSMPGCASTRTALTIFTGKIELGQGIGTALSQIAADELDVDWQRIKVVSGDTALTPNEGQTAGSLSVEQQRHGAALRLRRGAPFLLHAAAAKLGVAASDIRGDGTCMAAGGKTATYWELAAEVDLTREASGDGATEARTEHHVGRQERAPPRHPEEDDRRRRLRAGRAPARHGVRAHRASALARRPARSPSTRPR